jgi:hypothetical protein
MAYLFKQQFNINDLVVLKEKTSSVVIVEPDIYLAKLAELHLTAGGFMVYCSNSHLQLEQILQGFAPRALLINPDSYDSLHQAAVNIAQINKSFPYVSIVTITHNLEAEALKELMAAGLAGHINRKLSRPGDVVTIIKSLINN